MKKTLLLLAIIIAATSCSRNKTGKVLFIGVDGLASWCLETALDSIPEQIPNLKALMDKGSWTLEKRAVAPTASAINWATLMMGVPTELHGYIKWNSRESAFPPYAKGPNGMPPTLFTLLKEQRPDASSVLIYDWDGVGFVTDTLAIGEHRYVKWDHQSIENYAVENAVPVIEAGMPDFYFFYFVEVDERGHKYGWGSPEYYAALADLDKGLGRILDALESSGEAGNTTIVLTSDHGGKPDRKHGTYDIRDLRTPLIIAGPGIPQGEIGPMLMQYDVTAFLATRLGLEKPVWWRGRSDFLK